MARTHLSVILVALAIAALLLAATAAGQAKPGRAGKVEVQQASTAGSLELGKVKGYVVGLYMPTDRIVVLLVSGKGPKDGNADFVYSIYAAHNRGNLKRGVVRARFGSLGRVSLRFRPNGRVQRHDPQPGCEGGKETTEYGRFVGHFSFHRKGDIRISSPQGEATRTHSPRLRCKKGKALGAQPRSLLGYVDFPLLISDQSIALLYAHSGDHGRRIGIAATHREGSPPGADVQLSVVERRPGMAIGQGIFLEGPAGTLLTSLPGKHPATATLAPPAPFYGKASYSEETGAWTGTLGVRLAGSRLPLADPDYRVHLCVVKPLKDGDGCDFSKTKSSSGERPGRPERVLR